MAFGSISVLWNKWNIRGFIMLSLWLQVFLILFAPLRKKTTNPAILSLLWLAYLMADWVAAFVIGLISHNQSNSSACAAEVDGALLAFWASFLLLHFGGPDTITAFSMEDSSLWQRHLLSLIFQVGFAIYVFVQIFPTNKLLLIPTILVFLAGVIKNAERTAALNFSSLPKLRESVSSPREHPNDVAHKFVENSKVLQLESLDEQEVKLDESIVVKDAYYLFQMFVGLLGDLMFTSKERNVSREYFYKVSAMDALRVISVELQFMYEVLHTKTLAIHSKWRYTFRFIAFTNVVMAFVLFNRLKKHQLPQFDVEITYSLLFGGIALDVIALLMLVFSDWTLARIKRVSFLNSFVSATSDLRKPRFATCEANPKAIGTYTALDTPLIFQRWSESIFACNLISEYFRKRSRKMWKCSRRWGIISFFDTYYFLIRMVDKILFLVKVLFVDLCWFRNRSRFTVPRIANTNNVTKNPFIKELWIFIFMQVRRKSQDANGKVEAKRIFEAKGDLFLKNTLEELQIDCDNLLRYVTVPNFDASIIMWHITTEMWYNIEKSTVRNEEREFSKILSDYMMYLLLNQPNLVSTVAGIAQIRSVDTLSYIWSTCRHEKNVEELCLIRTDKVRKIFSKSLVFHSHP